MNKNDLRYQKTDIVIKKAFEDCINKNGFDKTTVSMICEKAMVNRNTFYIHFESKYDLLDSIFRDFELSVKENKHEISFPNNEKNAEWFIDAIIENRERFIFLSKCADERMGELFEKIFIDNPVKRMPKEYNEKKKDVFVQLNIKYIIGGALYFVRYWLEHYDEISREEAVKEINRLNQSELMAFVEKFDSC